MDFICDQCAQTFTTKFALKRHYISKHSTAFSSQRKLVTEKKNQSTVAANIICVLCPSNDVAFSKNKEYINHLNSVHDKSIQEKNVTFANFDEFLNWLPSSYCSAGKRKTQNNSVFYYVCNRSKSKVVQKTNKGSVRLPKVGGSIKMEGACPSRYKVIKAENGTVIVTFIEDHVGHNLDYRAERLKKEQIEVIVDQLKKGITKDRIIDNARKDKSPRMNLLQRTDLNYLSRKNKIDNRRDNHDMISTAMIVQEWNSQNNKPVFLFKNKGEEHPNLKTEDFALGYMNDDMKNTLKKYPNIICMDSTHGLLKYDSWELTTVLVQDEKKCGFPVAFLISNRKDQIIYETFLSALKNEITINCEIFMSDDDQKFYNAWEKIMNQTPKKLLCIWHVRRNWNIQAKKLRNSLMKDVYIKQLKQIMVATSEATFLEKTSKLFDELTNNNEDIFMNYLLRNYFNMKRIKQWAYYCRIGANINVNMGIESLHNYIKRKKLNGIGNNRLDKVLIMLEEVVSEKVWKEILYELRPNNASYQRRQISINHKTGLQLQKKIKETEEFGKFNVGGCIVEYHELCIKKCPLRCTGCGVCIHLYKCTCPTFCVKGVTCQHVHALAIYLEEKNYTIPEVNNVPDQFPTDHLPTDQLPTDQLPTDQLPIDQYPTADQFQLNEKDVYKLKVDHIQNTLNLIKVLPYEETKDIVDKMMDAIKNFKEPTSTKRKLEVQTYFPHKKSKN